MTVEKLLELLGSYPKSAEVRVLLTNEWGWGVSLIGVGDAVIGYDPDKKEVMIPIPIPNEIPGDEENTFFMENRDT